MNLQTLDNIDHNLELSEEEKKCLKGLHIRSKMGWLPKEPSLNDYKLLAEAYGEIFQLWSLYFEYCEQFCHKLFCFI